MEKTMNISDLVVFLNNHHIRVSFTKRGNINWISGSAKWQINPKKGYLRKARENGQWSLRNKWENGKTVPMGSNDIIAYFTEDIGRMIFGWQP